MKWTNTLPTKPGWYIWRIYKGCTPSFVYLVLAHDVITKTTGLCVMYPVWSTMNQTPADLGGQWAGPIEETEDAE